MANGSFKNFYELCYYGVSPIFGPEFIWLIIQCDLQHNFPLTWNMEYCRYMSVKGKYTSLTNNIKIGFDFLTFFPCKLLDFYFTT